jgi:hypothetical protein
MSFTYTSNTTVFGNKRIVYGVYTSTAGDTGGDIDTGLKLVEFVSLQPKGSAILANEPVVNETLPLASSSVTIVTTANEVGSYLAIGM